ncbi:MAG: hypothetical protein PHV30_08990 [Candidatus Margulisbacteria bacterium]|nr:hypothetical protein [Candidatus Margulisiibacteriota bacterium]
MNKKVVAIGKKLFDNEETLTVTEIKRVNQLIAGNPNKYLSFNLSPGYTDLCMLAENLINEAGLELATKLVNNSKYLLLGMRYYYEGLYQILRTESVENIKVGVYHFGAERGHIDFISCGHRMFLIKKYQGRDERKITGMAAEKGFGPKQYGPGIEIVEDFLGDVALPGLAPFKIGKMAGSLLKELHNENIIYADSFARHLRYDKKADRLRLIDFGVSFFYDGTAPVKDENLWLVMALSSGKGVSFTDLQKLRDRKIKEKYSLIPPEQLKALELTSMEKALNYHFKFPLQLTRGGIYLLETFRALVKKGLTEGYCG